MGDRANVCICEPECYGRIGRTYLYRHWGGQDLALTLQSALRRGESRWNDWPYLARIIFCEMVHKDDWESLTGFAITSELTDNEHHILVVDAASQRVGLTSEEEAGAAEEAQRLPRVFKSWTFTAYVKLSTAALNKAYLKSPGGTFKDFALRKT